MKFKQLSLPKKILVVSIPIFYIIFILILHFTCGKQLLSLVQNKDDFKQWISTFGAYDEIVFVSVRALQTVVKIIPAEPLEIGAGYVWGTYKGFALCLLGTEIGSLIILVLTSIFGVKLINLFFDVETINKWSFIANSRKKYTVLTIIYLIPGTPKDFLTYFIGVTDTNFWLFLLVTSIARIPSIISSTWCGSILQTSGIKQFVIIFALITLVSLIAGYFAKDIYNKKSKVNA